MTWSHKRADEVHVVLDHQKVNAATLADIFELALQILGFGRIEASRRLVEQQQARSRHQRAHDSMRLCTP